MIKKLNFRSKCVAWAHVNITSNLYDMERDEIQVQELSMKQNFIVSVAKLS